MSIRNFEKISLLQKAMRGAMEILSMTGMLQVKFEGTSAATYVGDGAKKTDVVVTVTVETWEEWNARVRQ